MMDIMSQVLAPGSIPAWYKTSTLNSPHSSNGKPTLKLSWILNGTNYRRFSARKSGLLDNQIRRTQHRLSTVERKRDTRKKILAGSWLLTVSQQDQVLALRFRNDLDGFLERDRDRELFRPVASPQGLLIVPGRKLAGREPGRF